MTYISFGGRGNDGRCKEIVFVQSFRHSEAAELALAALIGAPGMAGEVAANDHLDGISFAFVADGGVRQWHVDHPVWQDVFGSAQHDSCDLVEHGAFVRNGAGEHHVEGRDAVGDDHGQVLVFYGINVADLALIKASLIIELQHREVLWGQI